jgi:hypothetical protein
VELGARVEQPCAVAHELIAAADERLQPGRPLIVNPRNLGSVCTVAGERLHEREVHHQWRQTFWRTTNVAPEPGC